MRVYNIVLKFTFFFNWLFNHSAVIGRNQTLGDFNKTRQLSSLPSVTLLLENLTSHAPNLNLS